MSMTRKCGALAALILFSLLLFGCRTSAGAPSRQEMLQQAADAYGGPVRVVYYTDVSGMGGWEYRYIIVESTDGRQVGFVQYASNGLYITDNSASDLAMARGRRTLTDAYGKQCEAITGGAVVLMTPALDASFDNYPSTPDDTYRISAKIALDSKLGDQEIVATSSKLASFLYSQKDAILRDTGKTKLNIGIDGITTDRPMDETPYLVARTSIAVVADPLLKGSPKRSFRSDYGLGDNLYGDQVLPAPGWFSKFVIYDYAGQRHPWGYDYGDWQPVP